MNTITIFFGTESGNAEVAADDIAAALGAHDVETEIRSMEDVDLDELAAARLAIVVTSTYGDGEMPMTAIPFHEALSAARPDLSSLRFAAFGLGDSVYDTYNNAIDVFVELMTELGAERVGEIGRHDASGTQTYEETATAWAEATMQHFGSETNGDRPRSG